MEPIRTDLAVERTAAAPSLPGVTQETRGNAFSVTEIRIKNDVCGAPIGKPAGRYVTLEAPAISRSSANYQEMAEELAAELGKFLPQENIVAYRRCHSKSFFAVPNIFPEYKRRDVHACLQPLSQL